VIVSRSSSGGSGIGAQLFDSTLVADNVTIDSGAGGFDTSGGAIAVYWRARTDEAVAWSTLLVRLNADAGGNYDRVFQQDANAAVTGGNSLAQTSWAVTCAGAAATSATLFTFGDLLLYGYGSANNPKAGRMAMANPDQAAGNTIVVGFSLGYRSPTAVSRVSITNGGGTVLKAGSRLTVLKVF